MRCWMPIMVFLAPVFGAAATPTSSVDIGIAGDAGSTRVANGVYTVRAAGAEVGDRRDELRFVYAPLRGDGEIVARIDDLAAAGEWTKAGVMVRESLGASSRFAYVLLTGGSDSAFEYREDSGGLAARAAIVKPVGGTPYWLRLTRVGDVFTAYVSFDGAEWLQRGRKVSIPMAASTYGGLALTSSRAGAYATAEFSHVHIATDDDARGSATIRWRAPATATSGAPLSDLVAFKLYWGSAPGVHSRQLVINNPRATSWRLENLPAGRWYFAVSALCVDGFESAKSNEGMKLVL